jgi:hypothetical protein
VGRWRVERVNRVQTFSRKAQLVCVLSLALALAPPASGQSQPSRPLDSQVKAVYLLNFGRFVTWTPATGDGFEICLLGRDPFGPALDATLAGETIEGRKVTVRRLADPAESTGCRILYVGDIKESALAPVLAMSERTGMLTVSDAPQFVDRGGMIQFVSAGQRVRFRVNLAAAEQAGLMLSSELLRVAVAVKGSKPGA